MKRVTFSAGALIVLAGCAATQSAERQGQLAEINRTIPTCSDSKECEIKWAAARSWIISNAGWKLQHVTSDFLETYNAVGGSASLAVRVVKEPQANGSYRILGSIWCDNMFGCVPDQFEALAGSPRLNRSSRLNSVAIDSVD